MKHLKLFTLLAISIFVIASCGGPKKDPAVVSQNLQPGEKPEDAEVLNIDANRSSLEWHASKVTGTHNGTINIKSGELYLVEDQLVGGVILLDMTSIVVLDIEDPEMNERLTGHLKSDDFFSSETHPEGKFELANIFPVENVLPNEPNYTISGNLTLKGITQGITFPAFVSIDDNGLGAHAEFELDRTLWDIKFRSGKFFQDLGDNLIHDNFTIKLNILAPANQQDS